MAFGEKINNDIVEIKSKCVNPVYYQQENCDTSTSLV